MLTKIIEIFSFYRLSFAGIFHRLKVKDFEEAGASILLATKKGVVKKTEFSEFSNPCRKGVYALNIDEGDELIAARMTHPTQQIMLFTRDGMAVRFDESQVRSVGRVARGVRGVTLKNENDKVVGCEVVTQEETILIWDDPSNSPYRHRK